MILETGAQILSYQKPENWPYMYLDNLFCIFIQLISQLLIYDDMESHWNFFIRHQLHEKIQIQIQLHSFISLPIMFQQGPTKYCAGILILCIYRLQMPFRPSVFPPQIAWFAILPRAYLYWKDIHLNRANIRQYSQTMFPTPIGGGYLGNFFQGTISLTWFTFNHSMYK